MSTALKIFQNHYQADPVTNEVNSIELNSKFFTAEDAVKMMFQLIGEDEPLLINVSDPLEHSICIHIISEMNDPRNRANRTPLDKIVEVVMRYFSSEITHTYPQIRIPGYDQRRLINAFSMIYDRLCEDSFSITEIKRAGMLHSLLEQPLTREDSVQMFRRILTRMDKREFSDQIQVISRGHGNGVLQSLQNAFQTSMVSAIELILRNERFVDDFIRDRSRSLRNITITFLNHDIVRDFSTDSGSTTLEAVLATKPVILDKIDEFEDYIKENLTSLSMFKGFAIYSSEKPIQHKLDGKLHNASGPAEVWSSGLGRYFLNGRVVPKELVTDPENITKEMIDKESNAEARMLMMQLYTTQRYFQESKVELVNTWFLPLVYKDHTGWTEAARKMNIVPHLGKLFKDSVGNYFVECLNSTPNPDGTLNVYHLRVPSFVSTAREAIAWTFGLKEAEYNPVMMS